MRRWLAITVILSMAGLLPACRGCRPQDLSPGSSSPTRETGAAGPAASAPGAGPRIVFGQAPTSASPGPSESLAADLAAGRLSQDEAARYRVYRVLKPSAVPAKYRYAKAPRSGTWDLLQVFRQRARLSPQTRRELDPYLVAPTDPRSIFAKPRANPAEASGAARAPFEAVVHAEEPRWIEREYKTREGFTLRIVGEPGERAVVEKARTLLETHQIYETFHALLGRDTLHYGDRTLTIYIAPYLVDAVDRTAADTDIWGYCFPDGWMEDGGLHPDTAAAWVAISAAKTSTDPGLAATLAHEIFHAFQFAFSTREEKWLVEGSAMWAEDFVGHDWNDEQNELQSGTFDLSRFAHNRLNEAEADTAYGMYLFFYDLSRVRPGADPDVMRRIWLACESARGRTLASVTRAIGGDFNELFHDYAHRTLDEGDTDGSFRDAVGSYGGYDRIPLKDFHAYRGLWHIDESGSPQRKAGLAVGGMEVAYAGVTNSAKGPTAPAVRFDLAEFKDKPEIGLRAVIDYGDRKESEDWGGLSERVFCLAQPPQNFSQIYLAVSNSENSREARSFALDLRPDPSAECAPAQLRITMSEAGDEREHRLAQKWDTTHDTRVSSTWRHDMSFVLDLAPQRRNREPDADAASRRLPGPFRERFNEQMRLVLDGEADEGTGCTAYTLRVRAVQLVSFRRSKSLRSVEMVKDSRGVEYARQLLQDEHWAATGLARDTLAWLADERLEVRIYVDPRSGRIQWVRPSGPIGAETSGTIRLSVEGRQRKPEWPYTDYENLADSSSQKRTDSVKVMAVSRDEKALPMNPDWRAHTGSATAAEGGGQVRRPLDRTRESDVGDTTTTSGAVTTTVKWQLRFAYPVAGSGR